MRKAILTVLAITLLHLIINAQTRAKTSSRSYLTHDFTAGERFGTLFSRTIAVHSDDFPPAVFRVSGTGNYTVTGGNAQQPEFAAAFLYDGRPEDNSKISFKDAGSTLVYNGNPATNTDASGLAYNPFLWGIPPATLVKGSSWEVDIPQPWELGGAGHQKIEVVEAHPAGQLIRLKREGDGEGFFAGDPHEMDILKDGKRLRVKVLPGKHHWTGYTTFKNGIIISDELMVVRPLTLKTDSLEFSAVQRQYILLNQMPQ